MLVPTFVGVYLQIPDGITCTFNSQQPLFSTLDIQ